MEIDQTIAIALKTSLKRDSSDWNDVCDKWKKTYHMRQRDLKELGSIDFLQAWSKLSHSRAPDLVIFILNVVLTCFLFYLYFSDKY